MAAPLSTTSAVARFADGLLAADLPGLDARRRGLTVEFVLRRVAVLPSVTRFGVLAIGSAVEVAGAAIGHDRVRRAVVRAGVPLLSEYPRLVRSLGYAHVWETWPGTLVDGSPGSAVPTPDGGRR